MDAVVTLSRRLSRIQGWFRPSEGRWYANAAARPIGGWIVEVGSWKGLSTSYLAPVLRARPRRLWCVDHWKGSEDRWKEGYRAMLDSAAASGRPVARQFRENMARLKIPYRLLRMDGAVAARRFKAGSCALVLLDSSHDGLSVARELRAWWLKIAPGGLLAGHDYSSDHSDLRAAVRSFGREARVRLRRGPGSVYFFEKRGVA